MNYMYRITGTADKRSMHLKLILSNLVIMQYLWYKTKKVVDMFIL